MAAIAYISSALPLFYLSSPYGLETKMVKLFSDLFAIAGFLIVTWATIDLGTKIGVSPAKRGTRCTKGLYKFLGHPMYIGYIVAHLGWVFINKWNIAIYLTVPKFAEGVGKSILTEFFMTPKAAAENVTGCLA